MMRVVPIASSSKGNAYVVEQGECVLLVDCGVCLKRLKSAFDLSRLCGVLVTHNHVDHVSGLRRLLSAANVPVFANEMTAEAVAAQERVDEDAFVRFENGQTFEVGPFVVSPFSVPHDAADPVGYLVRGESVYFHGTDIGTPLDSVGLKLAEADVATLESNHDLQLLATSGHPPPLKQRIAGPRGHLSNDQAADLVRRFATPRLKRLILAHLSHECNEPRLALETMREALSELHREDVLLETAE